MSNPPIKQSTVLACAGILERLGAQNNVTVEAGSYSLPGGRWSAVTCQAQITDKLVPKAASVALGEAYDGLVVTIDGVEWAMTTLVDEARGLFAVRFENLAQKRSAVEKSLPARGALRS